MLQYHRTINLGISTLHIQGLVCLGIKRNSSRTKLPVATTLYFVQEIPPSVPDIWKQAFVTPIQKKGDHSRADHSKIENYHLTDLIKLSTIIRDQHLTVCLFKINMALHQITTWARFIL